MSDPQAVRKPGRRARRRMRLPASWFAAVAVCAAAVADPSDLRRDAVVEAVERVMPAVVNIATEEIIQSSDPFEDLFREFWGPYYRRRQPNAQYSLGSGVIIDEEGYVLTNLHVVRRANRVWVKLADGREFQAQPIVGTTRSDVALLKLMAGKDEKFTSVTFARDDDLLLGETVLALGNPFGLGGSVSRGILSSKNRRAAKDDEPLDVADWLQIDAPINFGNSGGPLINLRGELIGLNVAIHREGQGIGFAIPIRQVNEALSEIFVPEVTYSLWFGARVKAGPYPLTVTWVEPGGPAEQAGLRKEDQLVEVNGEAPRGFLHCMRLLGEPSGGETRVTYLRNGARRPAVVKMASLAELVRRKTGLQLQELSAELSRQFGYEPRSGLLIADVEPEGPAGRLELRPGYVIAGIDGRATPDLLSAANVLASKGPGDRAELSVLARPPRGGYSRLQRGTATVRVR